MVVTKDTLKSFKEQYDQSIKLLIEDSKNDPPTDRYRSYNASKEILLKMKDNLKTVRENDLDVTERDVLIYKTLEGIILHDLGCLNNFTKEYITGFGYLIQCLQLIEEYKMQPETIILHMDVLNQLAVAFINCKDLEKALEMLDELESVYEKCKELNIQPLSVDDICQFDDSLTEQQRQSNREKSSNHVEKVYTTSCLHRARVYGDLNEPAKSAQYCHLTIKKQLATKCYNPLDLASNAQTLGLYFVDRNMFREARHHLAVASLLLAESENKLDQNGHNLTEEEEQNNEEEKFKQLYAKMANNWCKYGLALLTASKDRLVQNKSEKPTEDIKTSEECEENQYMFKDIEVGVYEERISCDFCVVFDDAKEVYHFVLKWLEIAKDYYKPTIDATAYSEVIRQYAELYANMAFFESDPNNQSKMHKRRAKYYEELIDLLNPKHYLHIWRECRFGAGVAYCAIFDNIVDRLKAAQTPEPRELHKYEVTRQEAIKHFMAFIESFPKTDGHAVYDIESVTGLRTLFCAYFHLGRLYYKVYSTDLKVQLENLTKSYKYYKLFIDECRRFEEVANSLKDEIGVCRKLVKLLPLQIIIIQKRIPQSEKNNDTFNK